MPSRSQAPLHRRVDRQQRPRRARRPGRRRGPARCTPCRRRRGSGRAASGCRARPSSRRVDELADAARCRSGCRPRARGRRGPASPPCRGRRWCPSTSTTSPGCTCSRPERRARRASTPTPAVVMYSPSAAPRPTTLVSPVTMRDARRRAPPRPCRRRSLGARRPGSPPRSRTRPTATSAGRPARRGRSRCRAPRDGRSSRRGSAAAARRTSRCVNASRSPSAGPASRRRPAAPGSPSANASRNTASTSAADALPPAPWASVTTSSVSRGPAAAEGLDAVEHRRLRGRAARQPSCRHRRARACTAAHRAKPSAAWVSWIRWTLSDAHDEAVVDVRGRGHLAAVVAGQADREHAPAPRLGERVEHVARAAARRDADARCRRRAPWAISCRENTRSKPTSLPSAVSTAVSSTRQRAGSGRPDGGRANSAASDAASVELPPLPNVNSRPPPANALGHRRRPRRRGRPGTASSVAVRSAALASRLRRGRAREVGEQRVRRRARRPR